MSARSDPAQPVHHCGGAAAAVVGGVGGASRHMYPERAGNHLTPYIKYSTQQELLLSQ